MINIDNNSKKDCCGCTACSSVCPKNCITMTEDNEGFFYPVADGNSCINCGLCEKVCPVKKKYRRTAYSNPLFHESMTRKFL